MTKDREGQLEVVRKLREMGAFAVVVGDIQAQFPPNEPFESPLSTDEADPAGDRPQVQLAPEDYEYQDAQRRVAVMTGASS